MDYNLPVHRSLEVHRFCTRPVFLCHNLRMFSDDQITCSRFRNLCKHYVRTVYLKVSSFYLPSNGIAPRYRVDRHFERACKTS